MKALTIPGVFLAQSIDELRVFLPATRPCVDIDGVCLLKLPYVSDGFVAVLEKEMYALAIIGLLTTVMSAFYYLKIIKTIYFDDSIIAFEQTKNRTAQISIFASCTVLITFFLYPSVLNNLVIRLFVG